MNYKNIVKVLSLIGMAVATIFMLDILIAILYEESYVVFLFYNSGFLLINALMWFSLRGHELDLKIKDSIVIVNLLWVLLGIIGALPLFIYSDISFLSAFFEAISGFTTTGATVYTDIESLPHILLFHRSLMHWLGGLGVPRVACLYLKRSLQVSH